jgi:hypothetical protein
MKTSEFPDWIERLRLAVPPLFEPTHTWVRRMMRWHFSPDTGSPFWIDRKRSLGFDPVRDVVDLAGIARFGLFDRAVLRTGAVADLLPRGFANQPRRVFETGGTTGPPCRIVDVTTGYYNVAIYRARLECLGLLGGDAVAMTPSGPHAYGAFVARLVDSWAGYAYFVDFDPRWVRSLLRDGLPADSYIAHLVAQTLALLNSQRPRLLFTTSKLLLALVAAAPERLCHYGVRAVCTGGTSLSAEEARYLKVNYLDDVEWLDTYGNTLMGHALQGDPWSGWPQRAYYLPPPLGFARVVDANDWKRQVNLGERGRVLLVTLLEDLFIPNLLERDGAVRAPAHPDFPWEGLCDVQPWIDAHEEKVTEGVY